MQGADQRPSRVPGPVHQGRSTGVDSELRKEVDERVDRDVRAEGHAISTIAEHESVHAARALSRREPLRAGRRVRPARPQHVDAQHAFSGQELEEVFEAIRMIGVEPDPCAGECLTVGRQVVMGERLQPIGHLDSWGIRPPNSLYSFRGGSARTPAIQTGPKLSRRA